MKKLIITLTSFLLLLSCSKPEFSNLRKEKLLVGSKVPEFYSEFANTDSNPYRLFFVTTPAVFSLQYNSGATRYPLSEVAILADLANIKTASASGRVSNKDGSFVPQKSVSFEGVELKLTDYNYYNTIIPDISSWQKRVIKFQYVGNDDVVHQTELYCPDRITLFNAYSVPLSKSEPIEIRWNADNMNQNGVVLITEYNTSKGKEMDGFLLKDDGSFILPPDYVKNIPSGTALDITIQRGNASLITKGSSDSTIVTLVTTLLTTYKVSD